MSLDKVKYEPLDTPIQCNMSSPTSNTNQSVITAEDFDGMATGMEQGSAMMAAETHTLIEEEFVEPTSNDTYFLFIKNGTKKKNCFVGKMIPNKPGILVHNKELLPNQQVLQ